MTVQFSGLPMEAITPAHIATWQGLIDLFFAEFRRIGRRLPDVTGKDGKPITGPWRDRDYREATKCTVVVHQQATANVMAMHLSGALQHGQQRAMLQCYAASEEGQSVYTTIDLDVVGDNHSSAPEHFETPEEALEAARKLIAMAEALGLVAHLEVTKSGGYRVWIFHFRVPAAHAQGLGRLLVQRAGLHPKTEVFPAQAFLAEGQVGSAVFVPYGHFHARKGRQVMLRPDTLEVRMVEEFVQAALLGRSDPTLVEQIVLAATESGEIKAPEPPPERQAEDTGDSPLAQDPERAAQTWKHTVSRCAALLDIVARCEQGVQISRADWLRLATHLRPYGDLGYTEFHRLSEFDGRYDEHETDALWDSLRGGPVRCARMECGRDPQADCGMAEGKVSAVAFAYERLRQLPMAEPVRARKLRVGRDGGLSYQDVDEAQDTPWAFESTVPAEGSPWSLSAEGLWYTHAPAKGDPTVTKVLGGPLHIGGRVTDVDSGIESVELVWHQDRVWKRRVVARRTVSDARAILALADDGLGVNSVNASLLVRYIAYLLDAHQDGIPLSTIVSTTGWKKVEGQEVFVWGSQVIAAPDAPVPSIAFEPSSADTKELTDAFRASGTLEGWVEAHRRIGHLPTVTFGVMASLSAPFLRHLRLGQNPITDFAGRSSSGKTTAMKVAASAWGYPPEMGGLIRSWNSTQVFIERMVSTCSDLPSFLDESHVVRPELLQNTTYQLANGTGKGRGAKDGGTQRTARFRSVVISGGETQLTTASGHDGAIARVIGFWGSPFGEGQADLVRGITRAVLDNYGHAGPALVRHFLGRKEEIQEALLGWQEDFLEALLPLAHDGIGERLAAMYAAVGAVGQYANLTFGLGWDVFALVLDAFALGAQGRKTDNAQIALEDAVSHALGHRHLYTGSGQFPDDPQYVRGVEGRFMMSDTAGFLEAEVQMIAFLPSALKTILTQRGHHFDATVAQWRERGWLLTDGDKGRHTRKVRVDGQPTRTVMLTAEAVKIALGDQGQNAYGEEVRGVVHPHG